MEAGKVMVGWIPPDQKIKTLGELKGIVEGLRSQGKVIVFTNGCFDLIHAGHVSYLMGARRLGDVLIVGLNSDRSVRQIKGTERPFLPQDERALILSSLSFVDYVVIFDEPTPNRLLESLKPTIHTKGGDYREEDLPEAGLVQSLGGRVVIVPEVPGRSTTSLVERIRSGLPLSQRKTAVGIIPARYRSVRFEGKVIAPLWGKPLVQHVYERAKKTRRLSDVMVATDDRRVKRVVETFGGKVVMTSPEHPSGTDRIAEVAPHLDADIIVNIQGDEPLISPQAIDSAVEPLLADPTLLMSTLATPITDDEEYTNPNVVKVVVNEKGEALYFSRSPIPYYRADGGRSVTTVPLPPPVTPLRHIGLYAYSRDFLLRFHSWPPTPLERAENLEQMRALEKGVAIKVVITPFRSVGVDTPEDLERLERGGPPADSL